MLLEQDPQTISRKLRTSELPGVTSKHLVDQRALVDLDGLVMSAIPLEGASAMNTTCGHVLLLTKASLETAMSLLDVVSA